MHLDEWKEAWAAHGAMLQRSLEIDARLLRETLLRRARFALVPCVLWWALEIALGGVVQFGVVAVLAAHLAEARYLVFAGALALFVPGLIALTAHSLLKVLQLDYAAPVTALQREVEHIRRAEYRALKWSLLGGVLLWLPAALVLFEAVTGVAALARVDLAWLVANLGFGVVVLVVGQVWSRRHVERPDLRPWARRLLAVISGRSLQVVAGHLAELARFEREDPPAT